MSSALTVSIKDKDRIEVPRGKQTVRSTECVPKHNELFLCFPLGFYRHILQQSKIRTKRYYRILLHCTYCQTRFIVHCSVRSQGPRGLKIKT